MIQNLDSWNILFLFIAGQGIFLSVLLGLKYGIHSKNILISILVFLFSINIVENVFYWTNSYLVSPHVSNSTRWVIYLFGPLLLFYFKENKITVKDVVIHFLPLFIYLIYMFPYFILSADMKIAYMKGEITNPFNIPYFYAITTSAVLIFYSILLYQVQNQVQSHSQNSKIKTQFSRSFFVFTFFWILYFILVHTINFKIEYDYIISLVSAIMIYQIGYFSFLYPKSLDDPKLKYEKSSLKDDDVVRFAKILENLMQADKLYLENELRIHDLALKLNVTTNHLSQVINQYYQKNFTDFVNEFRISEAKKILSNPQNNDTILAIAYEVGFNNKTTFNITFKRLTGLSPSEYRKSFMI